MHGPRGIPRVTHWLCQRPANVRLAGAMVHAGCLPPCPRPRSPGVGWIPQPGPGKTCPAASSGRRQGGMPGGPPGGVAVPPHRWTAARARGRPKPRRSASWGCRPVGARRPGSLAVWCRVEEEGSPHPRGSLCLHLCFLPDSDCLALGSLLSRVAFAQPLWEQAGRGGFWG